MIDRTSPSRSYPNHDLSAGPHSGGDITQNTLVVTGASGDELIISTPGRNQTTASRGSIAGFQIVQIPEPSSATLLGVAGLGLLLRRRK